MSEYISKQAVLDWLDTEFVNTPFGAVSAKIKDIYNEINSVRFDAPSDQGEVQSIGVEVLSAQLVEEVAAHAKTAVEVQRLQGALRDAADTIVYLMRDYPNEMWGDKEREDWESVGTDTLNEIKGVLSPQSEKGDGDQ
ncbi:hypothetical protein PAECIP111893_02409 [Paenibacillus plantiphilus]|uniref:Uncharacterized protein n=1 Tax=Paenibacillus plantiphilus TaxID=2905650 RepID=A0ABM9C9W6_9BACL|nr:hypothetical protein [Paenibacillus plantiphilus]CAH1205751.1 hypothetical protein PAECIP111893_02409 [Paenibacillus plantiphilus]